MKVGLVSPYDWTHPGGVNEHIRHLAEQLRRLGHEVRVLTPASRPLEEPDVHRIGKTTRVPVNDSVARITLNFNLAHRVTEILELEQFDVIHLHEPFMPALPPTVLRASRTANVATFHAFSKSNLGYYYGRPLFNPYLRRLHAEVAVSAPARDFLRQYFPQADPVVIPNGVDIDRFRPDHAPIRHLLDGMVNILFVGRLEKRKGIADLLNAYAYLCARVERVRLVIVGDGPLRSKVESQISRLRLPNVVMAGFVPNEVLPRYYASADVFCAPATGGESFGIVLLEAMASGLPVVATEVPGYLTVVDAGSDSLTVRPHSPAELGAALTVIARDAELRRRLGAAGLAKSRRYSWREVATRILDVYGTARQAFRERGGAGEGEDDVHEPLPGLGQA